MAGHGVPVRAPRPTAPDGPSDRPAGRGAALRTALWSPVQLAPILVIPTLVLARSYGWVADVPLWLLVGSVLVAQVVTSLAYVAWPAGCPTPQMVLRVGVMMGSIGLAIYTTGWGPVLAFGYVFGAAENLRVDGSRTARPAIAWMVVATAVGQTAVGRGWLPSLLPDPEIHGFAVIAMLGTALVVALLRFSTAAKEDVEESLRSSEERIRALVQHASDVILVASPTGKVEFVSPSVERALGYRPEEFQHVTGDLVHPDDRAPVRAFIAEAVATPDVPAWFEVRLAHADGDWHWFEVGMSNRIDDPAVGGLVCALRDVTERRLFEDQLSYQAYHDALTRLPNRVHFLEELEVELGRGARAGSILGVLFLDVDRFKLVNDSLGHEVGDRLLVDVAERLRAALRPDDLVARFGGDEFTVLLRDLSGPEDAVAIAQRIAEALRPPVAVGGRDLLVSASIGIAMSYGGQHLAGDLLREADVAMYVAKEKGRARYEVFDAATAPHVVERLELEGDLWRALERGELLVRFQPEVSLTTNRIVACEALVRWDHPERGLLAPSDFIPVAEESSLILAIDRTVLREAARWARRWSELDDVEPLTVSVNLSPRSVRQLDAVDEITAVLEGQGVDPRRVQLEITERTALDDVDNTLQTLHRLRSLGLRVAIDDFGTGYSSLGYLQRLPVDVVKLDRSFVEGMDDPDGTDVAIVQAVITMGHALGMRVTAEGVERPEQARRLRELGCDTAMGWHWSRALAPEEVTRLLVEHGGALGEHPAALLRSVANL